MKLAETLPENASALDRASWMVVRRPGADNAAYQRALRQAEAACRAAPDVADYLTTLGAAYCRVAKWQDASEALKRSVRLRRGIDNGAWWYLALAHWHLGDRAEARRGFEHFSRWLQANRPHDEELQRLRAEVAQVVAGLGPMAPQGEEGLTREK